MREDYDRHLIATVQNAIDIGNRMGWNDGADSVSSNDAISWFEHPVFGTYSTHELSSQVRSFLCTNFCRTPNLLRKLVQMPAAVALTRSTIFQKALEPAFDTCPTPHPNDSYWLPGNHRFRYFDFARRRVYAFPKANFSTEGIDREIDFREKYASIYPWIAPICQGQPSDHAFSEDLQYAVPLNRMPSRVQDALMPHIYRALDCLHAIDAHALSPSEYIAIKTQQLDRAKDAFADAFKGASFALLDRHLPDAKKSINRCHEIPMAMSHGDFQPGNILVDIQNLGAKNALYSKINSIFASNANHAESIDAKSPFVFIDWEDVAMRSTLYDDMTFAYKTRAPRHLAKRLTDPAPMRDRLPSSIDFDAARSIWFFEEWIWLLESSSRQGIVRMPNGLKIHFRELMQW